MLFLRTAAGGFVNAAPIVRLCEEATGDEIRWVAICEDDRVVALAAYYSGPGRLKELSTFWRLGTSPQGPARRRRPAARRAVIAFSEAFLFSANVLSPGTNRGAI